jgi:hypothetical protein
MARKRRATPEAEEGGVLGPARTAAARLVAGGRLDGEVRLDELAAGGLEARRIALAAAQVDAYLARHPEEAQRVAGEIEDLRKKEGAAEAARARDELRVRLASLAAIDAVALQAPAADARLRKDLADYLVSIEGLTASRPGS